MWNLSAHEGVKSLVLKEHGVEALIMQLRESDNPDVWQKCAGCLMVLAANSEKIKNLVGDEAGVVALTDVVKKSEGNKPVLKAALGALAVLSSTEKNLSKMRAEHLEIDKFLKEKDERIVMFVKQLNERLYPGGA